MAYIKIAADRRNVNRIVIHGEERSLKLFQGIMPPSQEYPYWQLESAEGTTIIITGDVLIEHD